MTAKLVGNMLGLRTEQVSAATDSLITAGLIRYDSGEITVLDRAGCRTEILRVLRGRQEGKRSAARSRCIAVPRMCAGEQTPAADTP